MKNKASRINLFNPKRLREARESRGLTIMGLAKEVGVTHQSISKYENGKAKPSILTLTKICNVLNMPVKYMFKEQINNSDEKVVYFRSRANATVKSKKIHRRRLDWVEEIFHFLNEVISFPKVNIPIENRSQSYEPISLKQIELIAQNTRRAFGLGNGPISNVVLLLEKNGVIISRSDFNDFKIDACSRWNTGNKRPFIILGNDKESAPRSRFDIAHELGHLILHSNITWNDFNNKVNYKLIEKEANYFASAFLMPAETFGNELYSTSLDSFIQLKKRWKISIQAMAHRAYNLALISKDQYINVRKRLAAKNWLQEEPLDDKLEIELPKALRNAFQMIVDYNVVSKSEVSELVGLSNKDIETLCCLGSNFFEEVKNENTEIVKFKSKRRSI